jgi:hypothetical protein
MSVVLTPQRDDAVAALDPADRALLSLSVTRGLDDARIAQLTGVAGETVRARRERILATLATQLGILPDDVPAALRAGDDPHGRPSPPAPPPRPVPPTLTAQARPSPLPIASPDPPRPHARRRRLAIVASLLGLVTVGLVILVILVTHGATARPRALLIRPTHAPQATPTRVAPKAHTSVPAQRSEPLRPLPGGPRRASGMLTLSRRHGTLTLDVRVSSLPILHHGHYAVYLYDSILRSRPLGVVRHHGVTPLRLPADAARYREIDISDQPRGMVNPSGESRLRGPNPARAYARGARRGSRSSAPSTR